MNAAVDVAADAGAQGSPGVPVGEALRRAREAQGLSLGDVARQLKLSVRQVEALERGEIDGFSSLVFVRGFLRNYAKLVQVELDEAIGRIRPVEPPAIEAAGAEPVRLAREPRRALPVKLIAGVFALLVVGVFVIVHQVGKDHAAAGDQRNGVLPNPSAPPPGLSDSQVAQGPGEPRSEQAPAAPAEPATSAGAANVSTAPAAAAPEASAPASPAVPGPASGMASAPASQPAPAYAPQAAAPELPKPAAERELLASAGGAGALGSEVKLQFDDEAWVEIRDHAGKVVFAQLNKPGSEQVVAGDGPWTLVVGNARHVRVYYQGDPVDLAPHTRLDVARLTLQ